MAEFFQSYGVWIFFGLLFSLMFWRRKSGHGMGCCGGHQHDPETVKEEEQQGMQKHSSGCH